MGGVCICMHINVCMLGKKLGLAVPPQPRPSLEPLNLMLLPRER